MGKREPMAKQRGKTDLAETIKKTEEEVGGGSSRWRHDVCGRVVV